MEVSPILTPPSKQCHQKPPVHPNTKALMSAYVVLSCLKFKKKKEKKQILFSTLLYAFEIHRDTIPEFFHTH